MSMPNRPALSVLAATTGISALVAKKPASETSAETATARSMPRSRTRAMGASATSEQARPRSATARGRAAAASLKERSEEAAAVEVAGGAGGGGFEAAAALPLPDDRRFDAAAAAIVFFSSIEDTKMLFTLSTFFPCSKKNWRLPINRSVSHPTVALFFPASLLPLFLAAWADTLFLGI